MSNQHTFIESVAEAETREDTNIFLESTFVQELTGKKWKVRILQGDVQGSSAFYPKELLESNPNVVKAGTRVYLDHQQEGERPERKVTNLAGVFASDSYYENGSLYAEVELFNDMVDWVKERVKAGVVGLSIHGSGQKMEENGRLVAKSIDAIHSVDIVTHAGAGGAFIEMTESTTEKEEIMELPKELLEALDKQDQAMTAAVTALTEAAKKFDSFIESQKQEEVEEIEESATPSVADVSEALVESGLTAAGRKAVYAAVEAGTELEEAISTEKAREKEILEESQTQTFTTSKGNETEDFSPAAIIFD